MPTVTLTFRAPYGTPYNQVVSGNIEGDTLETALAALTDPIRAYYTFTGWFTATSNGIALTPDSIVPNSDTIYYAQWTPPDPVQVTFDAVDGSPVLQEQMVIPGQTYSAAFAAIQDPTRPFFTFAGWFTQPFGGLSVTGATTVTQTMDHTLYAQWTPPDAITVSFDAQGGTPALQSADVLPGDFYISAFAAVTTPTLSGYTFLGWFTQSSGGEPVLDATAITKTVDHILYAQWTRTPIAPNDPPGQTGSPVPPDPPVPPSPPAYTPPYVSYIPPNTYDVPNFREDIKLIEIHFSYLIGVGDNQISPAGQLTRAEAATILLRMLSEETLASFWTLENPFPDVPNNGGAWFSNAVSVANAAGLIQGMPDGSFQPNRLITRAEAVTILIRKLDESMKFMGTADLFSDIAEHWARDAINLAGQLGWVVGYEDGRFNPNATITRAEFATIVNRILERTAEDIDTTNMKIWSDNLNRNRWYYWVMQIASSDAPDVPYRNWVALQLPNARPEDMHRN